jgi:membrane protein implicated in regulation of membrane protease activity
MRGTNMIADDKSETRRRRWLRLLVIVFVLSLMALFWSASYFLLMKALDLNVDLRADIPSVGDMATLLFGASSLALILLSIFLAIAAFIGWDWLKRDVISHIEEKRIKNLEQELRDRTRSLEQELRGRVHTATGYMLAIQHSQPDLLAQRAEDLDYLSEALGLFRRGYSLLETVEGLGKMMALNNLVYFSCLYGSDEHGDRLLEQARTLKDIGQKYSRQNFILTYCRAVLQYGSEPHEIRGALRLAEAVRKATAPVNIRQMKEATMYVAELQKRIRDFEGTTGDH